MVSYNHPYDDCLWIDEVSSSPYALRHRARHKGNVALARSLALIPKLQTVYVPRAYFFKFQILREDDDDVVLKAIKNRSLQRIYSRIYWIPGLSDFEPAHPRLREVVHLPLPGPWTFPIYVAVGDRDQ